MEIPRCGSHVTVFSYGRPPSLRRRRNGTIDILDADDPAPALNLGGLPIAPCLPHRFTFRAGDQLLLYTDGFSETRNAGGAFFPLAAWAQKQLTAPPRQAVNNLQRALLEHGGNNLNDDIAAVAILKTS
ncbi:PP2C family protein-serine/threonine phosphatase [Streptomyces sp. NPDC101149]|uniref:PP2C family protein-serine/threonine phosphatase n=1 Tax=Streptomyces sp. NPDC101149 TaxID=3366113 RepID=UPI0038184A38